MADVADRLTGEAQTFVEAARRATLATIADDGRPRLVPVCFVVAGDLVWIPIDEKPKRSADPLDLARVRDVRERPRVALLVDRWDEDWARLGWVRLDGRADIVAPGEAGHADAIDALRTKYPQYLAHDLEGRPMIRVRIERTVSWGSLGS
jgi:PPOX class probable F420-dependent enzyme